MTVHVLPARMQPPHRDHLALLHWLVEQVEGEVVLGLIVQRSPRGPATSTFETEARRHAEPARNPFTLLQRITMLRAAVPRSVLDRLCIICIPRPESDWGFIQAALPGPRTWVVPDQGEAFDDAKAAWFAARGESLLRPRLPQTTDGRTVRALLRAGDPAVRHHLSPAVAVLAERWTGVRQPSSSPEDGLSQESR